jgi:hypothetical protein
VGKVRPADRGRLSNRRCKRNTVFAALFFVTARLSIFAADPQIDVSRIIDKATAESILATKLTEAASRNIQGSDGYYSKCNYYSVPPGRTLVLRIYRVADGYDPEKEHEAILKNSPVTKKVFGIDGKAFVAAGAEGALPNNVLMLYILRQNTLVTIGVGGFDPDAALQIAKTIAKKILPQL